MKGQPLRPKEQITPDNLPHIGYFGAGVAKESKGFGKHADTRQLYKHEDGRPPPMF